MGLLALLPGVCLAVLAPAPPQAPPAHAYGPAPDVAGVLAEVRGFHRDLAAEAWSALAEHFWPAKVVARWEPPGDGAAWATHEVGPEAFAPAVPGALGATLEILYDRARLTLRLARPSPENAREPGPARFQVFWLIRAADRWKISRLVLKDAGGPVEPGNR